MSYKAAIAFLISIFFYSNSFSQVTYFVKYKNSVDKSVIAQKIKTGKFFQSSSTRTLAKANFTAGYFAHNLGEEDPNLSRIVKLTFTDSSSAQNFISQIKNDPSVD